MRRFRLVWPVIVCLVVVSLALTLTVGGNSIDYRLRGSYFETCSCAPGCPCIFTSDATHGHCNASLVWKIAEGRLGDVDLAGTTVVVALASKGNMVQNVGKFAGALYLDDNDSAAQRDALAKIFTARFGGLFGSMVGPKTVPIEYSRSGDTFSVKIDGVVDAAIEPLKGAGGKTPQISNAPFALVPVLNSGVSLRHEYSDADLGSWSYEGGRNGFFADFDYTPD